MCGIFGYVLNNVIKDRQSILETLFMGLARLEYRGYDSAGIAFDDDDGNIQIAKQQGKVADLERSVFQVKHIDFDHDFLYHVAVAHTRWATHGAPSAVNSHPHRSDVNNEFIVVHNGIITNFKEIKTLLEKKGYVFESDTDTEVLAKLVKFVYDNLKTDTGREPTFSQVIEIALREIQGAFALLFKSVHYPFEAVGCRRGSPLLIGIRTKHKFTTDEVPVLTETSDAGIVSINPGYRRSQSFLNFSSADGQTSPRVEYFLASDACAIVEFTNRVVELQDNDIAWISNGSLAIRQLRTEEVLSSSRRIHTLELELHDIMKGDYGTFMQKEIFEQPESVFNTMRGRLDFETESLRLGGIQANVVAIRRAKRILFIACGTSHHSALAVRALFEEAWEKPVFVEIASDFIDRKPPIFRDDVCVFISQSGETADTLNALRYCKDHDALCIGVVNAVGSCIARETHCGVHLNAGPEISVASTKAFTSQVVALTMIALLVGQSLALFQDRSRAIIKDLHMLPDIIRKVLAMNEQILTIAKECSKQQSILLLGRGGQYAAVLEGALKIKELAYIHAEGIHAGDVKYGPMALVNQARCIIFLALRDSHFNRTKAALAQIADCGAKPVVLCSIGDRAELSPFASSVLELPIVDEALQSVTSVIALQLLAFHIGVLRDNAVDTPRNLAKSVTVE
ncbi:glutamine:fructose-6-phosphate aminotransferase 1 [Capsaspora owczarzaki ATCC 30864]|uniref:glutamine--fructose-6-phosphate transaminase (isomerizing) n=1 Tax=Capsaspora owczarzaki (strain ATCC 30864) TaxID=595528 RepID=A0A0D2WH72_CAPO3|nr:glutamine:fructose-6-phosphate aminotransferase 1 [Capsaspora owczarzaki ATCC 30864]KJE88910.1 glutamine:fructose-6-phosphate aminotransferase 1 [Capsaspora owczarzaki ATCC 30864]|eukprot:XP_004365355.1 glutamine:fructose-6-phosphate aminotransferase 1 [Capsaspora owczarzaki ATCC 30864]